MDSDKVLEQLDAIIDGLLDEGDLASSSVASILMAARDSIGNGYHLALAGRTWSASNALRRQFPRRAELFPLGAMKHARH
ncbi:hypothetical protein OJF2_55370 [Aquisphaera giovannonii]|uniref:Uncharacterized protein n=1 Tax=Aquisphaera giovannonii TaxID=406548 RepID=A0A5B9W8J6_9BACT|nr:hypothetical protein [Aquisphaera giovannonii]QEH36952.1 hypothetical protein OJF2_55370 [Aquisphaera giovannonii]